MEASVRGNLWQKDSRRNEREALQAFSETVALTERKKDRKMGGRAGGGRIEDVKSFVGSDQEGHD